MRRKTASPSDQDRFIVLRGGLFHYKRRVPAALADVDERAPHVRLSLKTSDIAIARQKRDALEAADDAFWASLLDGGAGELAQLRYDAAVKRAEAIGFTYRPASAIAAAPAEEIVRRIEALLEERTPRTAIAAVLGLVERPRVTITKAFRRYLDEIVPSEIAGKSVEQRRVWRKIPQRAVNRFVDLNGDLPIDDVGREHALKLFDFWSRRIAPPDGAVPTHTASSGNRDLGSLRVFYRDYYRHLGERDRPNPFADLSFYERQKTTRPPFPVEWIRNRLLAPGALSALNADARGILLAMVETGMRPSEVCGLDERTIVLDHAVPHVKVMASEDPENPRETKSAASVRDIPLVGVSLAVFQAHPKGFPRYRGRPLAASGAINKHLRVNQLLPTPRHSLYSLRHAFEDRMKVGDFDTELRMLLMGHTIDRPKYGDGGSLEWRQKALQRIAFAVD